MFTLETPGRSHLEVKYLEKDPTVTESLINQAVTLTAGGLATKAVAASTKIAIAVSDVNGVVGVVANEDAVFRGTADAVFAKTNRDTEVDLVVTAGGVQQIDLGASTTDVLRVLATKDAGTVGSALDVKFKINRPLAL